MNPRPLVLLLTGLCGAVLAGGAVAGPNAGGTILFHHSGYIGRYPPPPCSGGLTRCEDADVFVESTSEPASFSVYAGFPENAYPRLKAITFGIDHAPGYTAPVWIIDWGTCPDGVFELPGAEWPAPGSGTTVVWTETRTDRLVEIYWFVGYKYYADPAMLQLTINPEQGVGQFADDSVPAVVDDITGYGTLGFDTAGDPACPIPAPDPPGACCLPDGSCIVVTSAECSGVWLGPEWPCDPNPCEPVPVRDVTWGWVKSHYR